MNIREYIREEGRQEGRQEGLQKGLRQVALNMLQNHVDMPLICKMTGLPLEEIKKLQNSG